jgi:hypothetical protein
MEGIVNIDLRKSEDIMAVLGYLYTINLVQYNCDISSRYVRLCEVTDFYDFATLRARGLQIVKY